LALPIGIRWSSGNFGTVDPGRFYRSGQLSPSALARTIRAYKIRTVINLRGCNPDQAWYRAERAATLEAGAVQVDVSLVTDHWLSHDQARTLIELLDSCVKPALIHCEWGAERTGMTSSFVELLRPGGSPGSARGQYSPWYLYLPTRDGRIMAGHVALYESWLRASGLTHNPDRFRRWLLGSYQPPWPSREYWRCNPYPLLVVTRPGRADGYRITATWPANACPRTVATSARSSERPGDRDGNALRR